jgi:hypothetical protein
VPAARKPNDCALRRLLLSPLLHARKHLSFGLEPLMRVVLQHSSREMTCDRLDDMLRLACFKQIRDDGMPKIVKPEPR